MKFRIFLTFIVFALEPDLSQNLRFSLKMAEISVISQKFLHQNIQNEILDVLSIQHFSVLPTEKPKYGLQSKIWGAEISAISQKFLDQNIQNKIPHLSYFGHYRIRARFKPKLKIFTQNDRNFCHIAEISAIWQKFLFFPYPE